MNTYYTGIDDIIYTLPQAVEGYVTYKIDKIFAIYQYTDAYTPGTGYFIGSQTSLTTVYSGRVYANGKKLEIDITDIIKDTVDYGYMETESQAIYRWQKYNMFDDEFYFEDKTYSTGTRMLAYMGPMGSGYRFPTNVNFYRIHALDENGTAISDDDGNFFTNFVYINSYDKHGEDLEFPLLMNAPAADYTYPASYADGGRHPYVYTIYTGALPWVYKTGWTDDEGVYHIEEMTDEIYTYVLEYVDPSTDNGVRRLYMMPTTDNWDYVYGCNAPVVSLQIAKDILTEAEFLDVYLCLWRTRDLIQPDGTSKTMDEVPVFKRIKLPRQRMCLPEDVKALRYRNLRGGIDEVYFDKNNLVTHNKETRYITKSNNMKKIYQTDRTDTYVLNTELMSDAASKNMTDLFFAKDVWLYDYDTKTYTPVEITDKSLRIKKFKTDKLFNYTVNVTDAKVTVMK